MIDENKTSVVVKKNESSDWKIRIDEAIDRYGRNREMLLPSLKIVQESSGYITRKAANYLSEIFSIPVAKISSIASFYGMLTPKRQGKYVVRICNSLACFINSEDKLLELIERELGIKDGQTTPDHKFTLEVVACLGLCDQSPAMMINDSIYGHLTREKISSIFNDLKENG
jgi:NADH:ubiquinone oxidoreductase subunit E